MKIKIDFVTKSSSSAYVVSLPSDKVSEFEKYLDEMSNRPEWRGSEGFRIWERFDTKKQLYEHATDRPYDWASKAMHHEIENMDIDTFNQCLEIINDGCVALYVAVDYQGCDTFEASKYKDVMTHAPL